MLAAAPAPPGPLDRLLRSGALFHYARWPVYLGTMGRMRRALALAPGEHLLDLGCGTGLCASLARGPYLGVDTALPYVGFARRRFGGDRRRFAAMSGEALALRDGSFDKALIVNLVHHLDAAAVDALLVEVRRVVRGPVVLVDAAPEVGNALERALLRRDRGAHVRERPALRALLTRRYDLDGEETFHNALHIVPQVLFRLRPRRSP